MVQVFRAPERPRSFKEELARNLGTGLGSAAENFAQSLGANRENEALQRLGIGDVSGLSPDLKKEFVKFHTGAQGAKRQEKQEKLSLASDTIQEMKGLLNDVGYGSALSFFGPKAEAVERFSVLGRSLIPFVSAGVQIRNQKEFDEYKKIITSPRTHSQSQITGALEGLESLVSRSMEQGESPQAAPREGKEVSKKTESLKKLDLESQKRFLSQTKGSKEERIKKAKALAKAEGYEIE